MDEKTTAVHSDEPPTTIVPSDLKPDLANTPIDPAAEKRLLWKVDLHLIPILFLLYMCSFVDRINIGNAKIQGLEKDLNMKGEDYNIALFMW